MKRNLLAVVLGTFLTFTSFSTVHAQSAASGLDITLSPSVVELNLTPGDTIQQKFRVRNNGTSPVTLSITVDKLSPRTENGQVVPMRADPSDLSPSWFRFEDTGFTAAAKEWTDVAFTLSVPRDAALSNYFALRIGQSSSSVQPTTPAAKILGEVVLPVLLNVKTAGSRAELKLDSFAPVVMVNEYLPVSFDVRFTNTGNVHLKPMGNIFIKATRDTDLASLDINPGVGAILPDGSRTFTVRWNDGFMVRVPVMEDGSPKVDSRGQPVTRLQINWDKLTHFRIGKYTASLLAVYDNGQRDVPLEAVVTFWVFPYTLVAGLSVIVVILLLGIRTLLRSYVSSQLKKQSHKS